MNKRQTKKVGRRYHLVRQAMRQSQKRKGEKCIAYTIVEMGVNDRARFHKGGFDTEYPYATHWLVKVVYRNDVYFGKEHAPYRTLIYPCTNQGTSDSNSVVHVMFHWRNKPEDMLPFFKKVVDDMKADKYWESEY